MKHIELTLGEPNNYFVKEAFNTLRTNILFSGKQVKVILITSCLAHEGKTTISFETARSLAEADKKVLLIDADLRKSVTASRFTKERGIAGLSQILSGQVEIDYATYRTQITGMDMIFAGPYPPNPAELVGSPAFKELLDAVRDKYDYVIIDAPPLGLVIDAAIMATCCDGAVVVINQGNVKYRMAQNVKNQLAKSGCRILGVVLNQTQKKHRSSLGHKAYYGKYGEYYAYERTKTDTANGNAAPAQAGAVRRPTTGTAQQAAPAAGQRPAQRPTMPSPQGPRPTVAPRQAAPQPRPTTPAPQPRPTTPAPQPRPSDTVDKE